MGVTTIVVVVVVKEIVDNLLSLIAFGEGVGEGMTVVSAAGVEDEIGLGVGLVKGLGELCTKGVF